jgi:hypothetical protein
MIKLVDLSLPSPATKGAHSQRKKIAVFLNKNLLFFWVKNVGEGVQAIVDASEFWAGPIGSFKGRQI